MSVRKGGKIIAGSSGYRPGILTWKWSDHILNDVQQLLANTFSWQYGSMYEAAYNKLAEEFTPDALYCWGDASNKYYTRSETPEVGDLILDENGNELTPTTTIYAVSAGYISFSYSDSGTTYSFTQPRYTTGDIDGLESETINGVTVRFFISKNKFKISPASEESAINSIFQSTGEGWYYIIDKTNQRFKLPRERSREIIEDIKNSDGSWYRLYADGWVEQGGFLPKTNGDFQNTVTLPISMANSNYTVTTQTTDETVNGGVTWFCYTITNQTTTGFKTYTGTYWARYWEVSGMSNVDVSKLQKGKKYLYFYVGNFTQTALQNTAGINAELFNNKADIDKVANLAMPSDSYIDITVLSSGSQYTAPDDGYISIHAAANGGYQTYIELVSDTSPEFGCSQQAVFDGVMRLCMPVAKGSKYKFWYNGSPIMHHFRFYYAIGSKPV